MPKVSIITYTALIPPFLAAFAHNKPKQSCDKDLQSVLYASKIASTFNMDCRNDLTAPGTFNVIKKLTISESIANLNHIKSF